MMASNSKETRAGNIEVDVVSQVFFFWLHDDLTGGLVAQSH